ncbi:MAG: CinA family protein [Sphingomonadaceae bacterium]|jgi:nicotinamide-nucleotide amidase|nr:CinA family protein [Sphingomonadaceae bacterium]MCB2085095.1 CinA family protein [Sphingomonadaceae bacterium]MCP5383975.1 CinA family protein [Altererythrobacter sp.]MCP5390743.1 CinA family protein [Sphingomonadaceae bacterium]MCP5394139.1 CinA family protein [Sphingomonadaceae bacterium]
MSESNLPTELVELARRVIEENAAIGRTITLAESCTGGMVAAALTEIPGSSAVLERAFVTYSNDAKMESLGVASDIIETFGAVSIACAWAMAQGALAHSKADVAVAVSGVAGPAGGTELKPVGTVVFARAVRGEDSLQEGDLKKFGDVGRAGIRRQAALEALGLLLP